jgi:hypothetical protein
MPRKANCKHPRTKRLPEETIKIALPFERAIEGLLAVKPKKSPKRKPK